MCGLRIIMEKSPASGLDDTLPDFAMWWEIPSIELSTDLSYYILIVTLYLYPLLNFVD